MQSYVDMSNCDKIYKYKDFVYYESDCGKSTNLQVFYLFLFFNLDID